MDICSANMEEATKCMVIPLKPILIFISQGIVIVLDCGFCPVLIVLTVVVFVIFLMGCKFLPQFDVLIEPDDSRALWRDPFLTFCLLLDLMPCF